MKLEILYEIIKELKKIIAKYDKYDEYNIYIGEGQNLAFYFGNIVKMLCEDIKKYTDLLNDCPEIRKDKK